MMDYKFTSSRLLVDNFKACFLFYRDILGFKSIYGSEDDVYAEFNNVTVSRRLCGRLSMSETVGTTSLPPKATAQDTMCLCFQVENVDAANVRLKKQGVVLLAAPADRLDRCIRTAHFHDPDGNLIEINQSLLSQTA
jgi:lactoylglutathione lyase